MSRERASTMQSSGGATNCRLRAPAVRRRLAGHGLVRLDVEQVSAAAVGDDLDTRVREQHPDSDGNLSGTPRYTATVTTEGTLGPLAARLAPDLGLGGTIEARIVASGRGAEPPSATATARAEALTLLGRTFESVGFAGEVAYIVNESPLLGVPAVPDPAGGEGAVGGE